LPQTITLYNLARNPHTGSVDRARTILERVRVGTRKASTVTGQAGATTRQAVTVLVDKVTTLAWGEPPGGIRTARSWVEPAAWRAAGPTEREGLWTLAGLDWICARPGAGRTIGPEFAYDESEQAFRLANDVRIVAEVAAAIDKDGSIHHWEVTLD
jgi:hypothetical protein